MARLKCATIPVRLFKSTTAPPPLVRCVCRGHVEGASELRQLVVLLFSPSSNAFIDRRSTYRSVRFILINFLETHEKLILRRGDHGHVHVAVLDAEHRVYTYRIARDETSTLDRDKIAPFLQRIIRSTGGATHIWRRKVAEKEALELQKDNHKEMNEAHASFVNKLIGSTRKLITIMKVGEAGGTDMERPRIAEQRRSKKGSKASKAPFELFCVSKAGKYADEVLEKRKGKLGKRFKKLGEREC